MDNQIFTKTVSIHAPASRVWAALTEPALMAKWMSETPLEIITDWKQGGPITISGATYKKRFENKGTVLLFEPEYALQYSHLSSLSRLPDKPENYSVIDFRLTPIAVGADLTLTLRNFQTETIYKHLAFYWNVTLEILKKFVEGEYQLH